MRTVSLLLMMTGIPTLAADDEALRERCVTVLREGLRAHETVFWPAMHAAEAMTQSGLGAEVTAMLTPLQKTMADDQQRCGVARELARAGDVMKTALLWELMQAPSDHAHVHAAESLFKVGWAKKADLTPMRRALAQQANPRLRMMAAAALARHTGDAEAMTFLRTGMAEESNPDLLFLYAWGLGQLGTEADVSLIQSRLNDMPDAWLRSFLEHALARLGDATGRAAVLRNLEAEDARIVPYAAETAGAVRMSEARVKLISLLEHSDLDTRIRAAQALLLLFTTTKP